MVFAIAATMKAYYLATQYVDAPNLEALAIGFEGVLVVWLIAGVWPRVIWSVTGLTLIGFLLYNIWQVVGGADSCGCLGIVSVPPGVMLVVDGLLLLLAWLGRPTRETERSGAMWDARVKGAMGLSVLVLAGAITLRVTHGDPIPSPPPPEIASETKKASATTERTQPTEPMEAQDEPHTPAPLPLALTCDMGYIKPGATVTASVTLTNTTDRTLTVTSGRSNCTCIKINQPKRQISPGTSSPFQISLAAPKKKGRYHKVVILRLDDPDRKAITIHVAADIGLPLKLTPDRLTIGSDPDQEPPTTTLRVTNRGEEPIKLLYSTATVPGVYGKVPREAIAPGQSVDVAVHHKANHNEAIQGTMMIHTDHQNQPHVQVAVAIPKSH